MSSMTDYGIEVIERRPIQIKANQDNKHYLFTKKSKLGHLFKD